MVRIECYGYAGHDDDPLSVTDTYLVARMDRVIHVRQIALLDGGGGTPDIDHAVRAGGAIDKAVRAAGIPLDDDEAAR